MADNNDTGREAFEAWAEGQELVRSIKNHEEYASAYVQNDWEAFQAGRASITAEAEPAAWQERQRILGGQWSDWYGIRFGFGQLKGERSEVIDSTEYQWRPLYAAPQPNAALADGWQDIALAPQDWTIVDLWAGERIVNMRRVDLGGGNVFYEPVESGPSCVRDATHFRYPPAPPTLNASKEAGNG